MMQSSSRSPKPHIGASVITSLYVVMTGLHEPCSEHHAKCDF
jgi:pyrimidine deaminase RibD-like protein